MSPTATSPVQVMDNTVKKEVASTFVLPVIEVKALPTGTKEYEEKRHKLRAELSSKIPASLHLPPSLIEKPPKNVMNIPETCKLLTAEEMRITSYYDATSLLLAMANRTLSSVQVVNAFGKRAAIAHQLTACLTDYFLEEALGRAKELDDYLAKTGKVVGPLHGLPISVKSHIPVGGHLSDAGFMSTIETSKEDCQMIAILRSMGAVFYVKTNQPQALMHLETDSYLYRTLNPHNIYLSSGGSTGGESALLAMRGSILGIGTDIGGSIRGPSAFCGIWGFKPTSSILPTRGYLAGDFAGGMNTPLATGPMATTFRDCELFVKSVLSQKPYLEDPNLKVLSWEPKETVKKTLRIGVMLNDGLIQPQPPVVRALEWIQKKLQSHFELVPFQYSEAQKAISLLREEGGYWPDAGTWVKRACAASGEPLFPLTESVLKDAPSTSLTATENLHYQSKLSEFQYSFVQSWNKQNVDIVVAPCFVGPASMHDTAMHWNYTFLWNAVDYPSLVFPTPIQSEAQESYKSKYSKPLSADCQTIRQLWESGDFEGAPINLQLIARKNHDIDLWEAMRAIETVLSESSS